MKVGMILEVLLRVPEAIKNTPLSSRLCTGHVVRLKSATPAEGTKQGIAVQFDCFEVLGRTQTENFATASAVV